MTLQTTFPKNGREAPGLPAADAAVLKMAEKAGAAIAVSLLQQVTMARATATTAEGQELAGQAVLAAFLQPLLPLIADALELFGSDTTGSLLGGLIEDVANGAAMALDGLEVEHGSQIAV